MPELTSPSASDNRAAAADHSIAVSGEHNVVVTGDVHGNLTVIVGGRDVRGQELAYLDGLVEQYRYWANKYTPLAGIAEVRAAAADGPRLDLPMLFMPAGFEKLQEHGLGEQRRAERVPVDDLRQAVAEYRRLVLLGEPGSGKTTTLWRLAYDYAATAQADIHAPLPLLVPLSGFTGPESALSLAQGHFGADLAPYLPAYLNSRRVILLLDGLNEMPQRNYRERIGRVQALLDRFPEALVVVTCRELDYEETLWLEKLEIKSLNPQRQRAYLHRYLGEIDGERLFWLLAGDDVAGLWRAWQAAGGTWEQFWMGEKAPVAVYLRIGIHDNWLWKQIYGGWLPPLWALGQNPFMLVMLAQVYAAGHGTLPQNRGKLFAAFVDTLLGREERRCDPDIWLGPSVLKRILSELAFAMQSAGEYGTAVDMTWATSQLGGHNIEHMLRLCASATLLNLGDDRVRFVHQLVQEHFAAMALGERLEQGDDLRKYWPGDWTKPSGWEETAVLLAGALPDMTLLVERLSLANPALAVRCLFESGGMRPDQCTVRALQGRLVGLATDRKTPRAQRAAAGDALNHVGDPRPGVGLRPDGLPDIAWCEVPAGEFIMGNSKQYDYLAYNHEAPQHQEPMPSAYRIGKYPITNAQFEAFVRDGGYTDQWRRCWTEAGWQWQGDRSVPDKLGDKRFRVFDLPNHPVVMVSWYEAQAFCNWLGQKLGQEISLPSEAQWEKAARWIDGRWYPWGDELTAEHANCDRAGIGATSAVGIFPDGANPETGVHDMSGNVWEWCRTKWRDDYGTPADEDPEGDAARVLRGGAWHDGPWNMRCAYRDPGDPRNLYHGYSGFRVVASCVIHDSGR